MIYICHGCGGQANSHHERCKYCGTRQDVSDVINHILWWDGLNEEAKAGYIKIIEMGLDQVEVRT